MYDKLFGKICLDRQLITPEQLDDALAVRNHLKRLGLDRRIGEILVSKGYLAPEVAAEIAAQQHVTAVSPGESILGRLAIQNGMLSDHQLDRALALQRTYLQESGVAPTLGFILVEEGFLAVQQLDALIAAQNRLQAENRLHGAETARLAADQIGGLDEHTATALFLVTVPGKGEQVMTGATLRAKIVNGHMGIDTHIRREDEQQSSAAADRPEFATAVGERKRREMAKLTRQGVTSRLVRERRRRVLAGIIVAIAIVGAFVVGTIIGGPADSSRDPDHKWSLEDMVANLNAPPRPPGDGSTAPIAVRPAVKPGIDPAAMQAFMAAIGLFEAITPSGAMRWIPAAEHDQLARWAALSPAETAGLQPFEVGNEIVYAVPMGDGIRLAHGTIRPLGTVEVERQRAVWATLLAIRARALADGLAGDARAALFLEAATHCDRAKWPIHARRQRVDAFRAAPLDSHVRTELGFLAPGENPSDPTVARLLTNPDAPALMPPPEFPDRLPTLTSAPGLLGPHASPEPPEMPWTELIPPLEPDDVLRNMSAIPDAAAERRRAGQIQYLGYWLPSGPFARWWPTARHPTRRIIAAGTVVAWTDLPQFRGEIVDLAGRIYPLLMAQLPKLWAEMVPEFADVPLRQSPAVIVIVGATEGMPTWVGGVEGSPVVVRATDLRTPDALVIPVVRGFCAALIRASLGRSVPPWLREAWAMELASRFARENAVREWHAIERALAIERIATMPTAAELTPADLFYGPVDSPLSRAHAHAVWRILAAANAPTASVRADLLRAIRTGNTDALGLLYERLGRELGGKPWGDALAALVAADSRELMAAWEFNAVNAAFFTPGHLSLLDSAIDRRRLFGAITGIIDRLDGENIAPRDAEPIPVMSTYSLRELLAVVHLASAIRVLMADDTRTAAQTARTLADVFTRAGKPEWAAQILHMERSR